MRDQDGLMGVTRDMSQRRHARVTDAEETEKRQEAVNMDAKGQKEKVQLVKLSHGHQQKIVKQEFLMGIVKQDF